MKYLALIVLPLVLVAGGIVAVVLVIKRKPALPPTLAPAAAPAAAAPKAAPAAPSNDTLSQIASVIGTGASIYKSLSDSGVLDDIGDDF